MPVRVTVALLALALCGCPTHDKRPRGAARGAKHEASRPKTATPPSPRLELRWNAKRGKGYVVQVLKNGDLLRAAFHDAYAGYTGGLIIGSLNGSGYGLWPHKPIRGFRQINVYCAQDESIWDHQDRAEYTYGWSENFGTGKDGKRLAYRRGKIVETGPGRVVLYSENAGGCYTVSKVAYTRLDVAWWIIATQVENTCHQAVRFDFFTGDDPWIGLYRSSDGDVGWTPEALVRTETVLGVGRFTAGGFYDLGNQALGQREGSAFSNQANFVWLDPALPLPDLTIFANRFAHDPSEIDPARPLDNKTLTALNMGWRALELEPGQRFTTAMALGLARTGQPTDIPRLPDITLADWSVWRRYLREAGRDVAFAAERVELDLTPRTLHVRGTYHLYNHDGVEASVGIQYPILSAPDRPAPSHVTVDGRRVEVREPPGEPGARPDAVQTKASSSPCAAFQVRVPAYGLARFVVDYTQAHHGRQAGYMVTSALRWSRPITRAVFVVRHPRTMGRIRLSYAPDHSAVVGQQQVYHVVRQPFVPRAEMMLRW